MTFSVIFITASIRTVLEPTQKQRFIFLNGIEMPLSLSNCKEGTIRVHDERNKFV